MDLTKSREIVKEHCFTWADSDRPKSYWVQQSQNENRGGARFLALPAAMVVDPANGGTVRWGKWPRRKSVRRGAHFGASGRRKLT
jgi:hypothetical protein